MEAQRYDLYFFNGDTYKKKFEVSPGTDFTSGYTAQAHFRYHVFDDDTILELSDSSGITLNDDGSIDLELSSNQTNSFNQGSNAVFDVKITDTSDQSISTVVWGNVSITPSVTRP